MTSMTLEQEERHINTQLRDLEARLVDQYSHGDESEAATIRALIASLIERFADSRVKTFIPILIERAARAQLVD